MGFDCGSRLLYLDSPKYMNRRISTISGYLALQTKNLSDYVLFGSPKYKNIRTSSTISGYLALQIKNLSYGFAVT